MADFPKVNDIDSLKQYEQALTDEINSTTDSLTQEVKSYINPIKLFWKFRNFMNPGPANYESDEGSKNIDFTGEIAGIFTDLAYKKVSDKVFRSDSAKETLWKAKAKGFVDQVYYSKRQQINNFLVEKITDYIDKKKESEKTD